MADGGFIPTAPIYRHFVAAPTHAGLFFGFATGFLALYAILRSIPNKHAGVAAVTLVIITLFLIGGRSATPRQCWRHPRCTYADSVHLLWIFGADVGILGWSGSHCTPHAIRIGQLWGAISCLCMAAVPFRSACAPPLPGTSTMILSESLSLLHHDPVFEPLSALGMWGDPAWIMPVP